MTFKHSMHINVLRNKWKNTIGHINMRNKKYTNLYRLIPGRATFSFWLFYYFPVSSDFLMGNVINEKKNEEIIKPVYQCHWFSEPIYFFHLHLPADTTDSLNAIITNMQITFALKPPNHIVAMITQWLNLVERLSKKREKQKTNQK